MVSVSNVFLNIANIAAIQKFIKHFTILCSASCFWQSILLSLFRMGAFGVAHISCCDETWHSYTIPKKDSRNI